MPEYDPKNIPILDDVIETVEHQDIEIESIAVGDEDGPALFTAEPVVDLSTETDDEDTELESDIVATPEYPEADSEAEDSQTDSFPAEHFETALLATDDDETDDFKSALIDYDTGGSDNLPVDDIAGTVETDEASTEVSTEAKSSVTITDSDLQSISDEIVTQLMPELEQHLRILVQKVLEEKLLPESIPFNSLSTTNIDD